MLKKEKKRKKKTHPLTRSNKKNPGLLAIPQSLSYSQIAGLPMANGLFCDLQVVYPILGNSRYIVVGPVAIMSLMTNLALSNVHFEQFSVQWIAGASLLCFYVGLLQILFSTLKKSETLMGLLSEVTIKAFVSAAAVTIIFTQLPAIFLSPDAKKCTNCAGKLDNVVYLFTNISFDLLPFSLGAIALLEFFRIIPHPVVSKLGPLALMLIGFFLVHSLPTIGFIPKDLPNLGTSYVTVFRAFDMYTLVYLLFMSIPIAIVGFTEAYAITKACSAKYDKINEKIVSPLPIDADRELLALGLANVFTSVLNGFPVTGSFSRTAVNGDVSLPFCDTHTHLHTHLGWRNVRGFLYGGRIVGFYCFVIVYGIVGVTPEIVCGGNRGFRGGAFD